MGMFELDYCDYAYDKSRMRQLKRKRFDLAHSKPRNSIPSGKQRHLEYKDLLDSDYESFINYLLGDGESSRSMMEEDDDDCDEDDDVEHPRHKTSEETDNDDVDPQHKLFMEKVKQHEKSYILEVAVNNGVPLFIKYEAEDGSDNKCAPPEARRQFSNVLRGEKTNVIKNSKNVQKKQGVENPKNLRGGMGKEKRNSAFEKDLSSKSEPHHMLDMVESPENSYEQFLRDFPLAFEKDDSEFSSEVEILETDDTSFGEEGNSIPVVNSRTINSSRPGEDLLCLEKCSRNGHSQFREKVMDILEKPYDPKEFEELWRDVREQLPMERERMLRGRTRLYSTDRCGKSYLDHHPDLKKTVEEFRHNHPKLLNIFRGFFFWLKNLSYEDAFPPWLDPSCLAVMPGSR